MWNRDARNDPVKDKSWVSNRRESLVPAVGSQIVMASERKTGYLVPGT